MIYFELPAGRVLPDVFWRLAVIIFARNTDYSKIIWIPNWRSASGCDPPDLRKGRNYLASRVKILDRNEIFNCQRSNGMIVIFVEVLTGEVTLSKDLSFRNKRP